MITKLTAIFLLIASFGLLIPGITQPILTLQGSIDKSKIVDVGINMIAEEGDVNTRGILRMLSGMMGLDKLEGDVEAYSKTRSIVGTVKELASQHNYLVACLVALFAIVIPLLKLLLQLVSTLLPVKSAIAPRLKRLASFISKWSMADVFVIAIIVTYLAGNANGQMGDLLKMKAEFGSGFWFFLSYCMVAILSTSFIDRTSKE
jgi:hypothetical protein